MPQIEKRPDNDDVVLVKQVTPVSDTGVTGFNARYVPLLGTIILAGVFAIAYLISR